MRKLFVTGIGTDVGKTVVSAAMVEGLKADYWKPVQCGELENSDAMKVQSLVSNTDSEFHPESYRLKGFMSPHAAAKLEETEISINTIILPDTDNHLIVEGAGGLMVPLNDRDTILDLMLELNCEVVVVSRNYLGSINHTLLTLEVLKARGASVAGIVFNGEPNTETERIILETSGIPCIGRIGEEKEITKKVIDKYAPQFKNL